MAFCQFQWFSKVLGRHTTTWVLLPDDLPGPFATYYLLHGLSDDQSIWMRKTRIEAYAEAKPLIIVMPNGDRGFYTNHENGPKWADHIGIELPTMIERCFPAISETQSRFIGGLSMGGYGALRIALGYPNRFASATSHSGALMFGCRPSEVPERILMIGTNPAGTNHDLRTLALKANETGNLPRLRIDCGLDDFLLQDNRAMHQFFTAANVPHEYQEYPGSHNWDYWDLHVREAIEFHLGSMTNDKVRVDDE